MEKMESWQWQTTNPFLKQMQEAFAKLEAITRDRADFAEFLVYNMADFRKALNGVTSCSHISPEFLSSHEKTIRSADFATIY